VDKDFGEEDVANEVESDESYKTRPSSCERESQ
jgi:hypothetical protein